MESLTRVCSVAGIASLAVMSWIAVVWAISPFVAEAVSALHHTYGY
jgi:hypothetical protein